jgi:hypothetical protein
MEMTPMTIQRLVSTAALSLLLGSTAMVWAQDDHNDAKPPEPRPEATRPQDDAKPRPEEPKRQREEEAKPQKQEKQEKEKANKGEGAEQDHRGQAGAGHRIPEDKFRSHFGRQHTFVVNRVTVVEGRPHFQYGGFGFQLVEVWPVGWAYTDDCYIDFIDGEYFLFNLRHPGVRVAVVVVE